MHWLLANEYARSGGRGEPMGLEFIFSLEPLAAFILLGQCLWPLLSLGTTSTESGQGLNVWSPQQTQDCIVFPVFYSVGWLLDTFYSGNSRR